jgi:hypothetical protein
MNLVKERSKTQLKRKRQSKTTFGKIESARKTAALGSGSREKPTSWWIGKCSNTTTSCGFTEFAWLKKKLAGFYQKG